MSFSRPTITILISRAQSDVQTRLTGAVAKLRRSVEYVLARVVAGAAHGLHGHLVWLSRQLFPDTAEDEFIERWASIWGLNRTAATAASGTIAITGSNGTTCPDATEWQTLDGAIYVQDGDVTISGGTATATVVADEAGADGNLDTGTAVSLVSPVAGIDSDASVTGVDGISGGTDSETDAALLARLLLRLQNPPNGGGPGDYVNWALEVSGVTRAWEIANGDGLGTVVVYFVRDNDTPIIPDSGEVATVQSYLDDVAPITADVNVYAPTDVDVDFTISVTPDTAAVRAAVEAELEDYIDSVAEADGTTSMPLSQLNERISIASGETDHTMTVPATAPTFSVGEIPVMGTVTWV